MITSSVYFCENYWGRRIERRHSQLDQIQDGGRRPSWKTSNG